MTEETPEPDLDVEGGGCPNNRMGYFFVHKLSGEIAGWRCSRNACGYCVQGNARKRARAISLAAPERAILLTQVGDSWSVVQNRVNLARHRLQKAIGAKFDWVWHVEPNPEGTGHHVHAWQRGGYIPQSVLSEVADGVGMGDVVFINKIRQVKSAAQYGLKGLGYGLKGVAKEESRAAYLIANGRRLTHQSRGFFLDSDGQSCGVRDAERAASSSGEEPGLWQLMTMPLAPQNG